MTSPVPASPETGYYGQPLLKPPVWTWEVPTYFFVGGAAGASAVIAAVAEWTGGSRALARDARWIAAAGGPASAALLTADLGRPERFLHMLRVFKPQSAMSVGSWTLTAFSTVAAASAFAAEMEQRWGRDVPVRLVSRVSTGAAGVLGTLMSTYPGVLIGATAIPAWNENVRVLPVHFAASGLSSAVALLELFGHDDDALNALGMTAAVVETLAGFAIELKRTRSQSPLHHGTSGLVTRVGGMLSGPVALALRVSGRNSRQLRQLAAVSALAGSFLTRLGWIAAGRVSAHDPRPALSGIAHETDAPSL